MKTIAVAASADAVRAAACPSEPERAGVPELPPSCTKC